MTLRFTDQTSGYTVEILPSDLMGGASFAVAPTAHIKKAARATIRLNDLVWLRDGLTKIIDQQTGADTVPGCDGSYTCRAHFHSPFCLLTPGN